MAAARGDFDEQDRRARKGTEVFVGGLPRSATESTLREVFSPCGEIVDVRVMKDQNGLPKGYAFIRFAKREYANTARRQKNGIELQGKRLVVDLSMDQDTVFFGNLSKDWTSEEFEELIHKTFEDVVSVDLAMASNPGSSRKRHINRGFGFVRFSSHSVLANIVASCFVFQEKVHFDKQSYANTKICAKIPSIYPPKFCCYLINDSAPCCCALNLSASKRSTCAINFMHDQANLYATMSKSQYEPDDELPPNYQTLQSADKLRAL